MQEKSSLVVDTSAFLSIESIGLLDTVKNHFQLVTSLSVIGELEQFAEHEDKQGNNARNILSEKEDFLIRQPEIKEKIQYLHKTDNDLFNLALQEKLPLITDDHKIAHHTEGKIEVFYSTFFLIVFVETEILSREEAKTKLEQLRDIRNWKNNIIYLTTLAELNNSSK